MLETLEILRPSLKIEESTPTYALMSLEPLERGYGMTIGNALRRVLLSSIRGAAITAVRIDGVLHEFSTVPGVHEDVIEILMNLKHIPVRSKTSDTRVISFSVEDNSGTITAGDLPIDPDIEFVNPDAKICTVEPGTRLSMDLYINQGTGYLSADRPRSAYLPVDALLTDAIFSPVLRVNYRVDAARHGERTDYDKLTLEIWTNGIVTPEDALKEASKVVQTYFEHILFNLNGGVMPDMPTPPTEDPPPGGELLGHSVHDLELSIRSENCLLRGGIQTIGELLLKSREDLLKIRNLGKISLTEIEEKLAGSGLKLRDKKDKAAKD